MVRQAANGAAGTEDELADLQRRFHLLGKYDVLTMIAKKYSLRDLFWYRRRGQKGVL